MSALDSMIVCHHLTLWYDRIDSSGDGEIDFEEFVEVKNNDELFYILL